MGKGFSGRFHKSGVYRRFALSFIAVLILPVCAFSFLFLHHFYRIYQEKIIGQAQGALDVAARELDRELEELANIANYNSQRSFMEDHAIRKNYTAREITGALAAETATHSILENIYYYDAQGQETVYSAGGTYSLRYFTRFYMGTEEEGLFLETLGSTGLQVWHGNSNRAPNLYYVMERGRGKWWLFPLAGEKLREILSAGDGVTVLLNAEGMQIFPGEQAEENKDGYYMIASELREGGRLIRHISEKSLFAELHRWQGIFIALLFVVLLGGGVLVCFLSAYNERPVRELQLYCREKIQNIPNTLEGFEIFRFAMRKMEENVNLLKKKQWRNSLLQQLIFGWECNSEDFREDLKEAGLFSKAEQYRVIVASPAEALPGKMQEREKEMDPGSLEQRLNEKVGEGLEYRVVDTAYEDSAIIILGLWGSGAGELERSLTELPKCFQSGEKAGMRFFVGESCQDLSDIRHSYLGAVAVMTEGNAQAGEILYCPPQRQGKDASPDTEGELRDLYEALVEADIDQVSQTTDRLIEIMESQEGSRSLYTALYYNVLNTYYKALSRLALNTDITVLDMSFLEVKDREGAISTIRYIKEQFGRYIGSGRGEKQEKHVISRVLAFIDENCRSCDLSVSIVADYFHMSISNLSHQFRQQTGRKISDYIMEKMMEHARELLLNSDYRVQDIAQMLGYTQTSNFTRKFRQYYGMTPGEYRNRENNSCNGRGNAL